MLSSICVAVMTGLPFSGVVLFFCVLVGLFLWCFVCRGFSCLFGLGQNTHAPMKHTHRDTHTGESATTTATRAHNNNNHHHHHTTPKRTRVVALLDHHLLREEDLLRRDLHAEVAARDHHAVGLGEDFVKVLDALLVLDLGDDLDVAVFVWCYCVYWLCLAVVGVRLGPTRHVFVDERRRPKKANKPKQYKP
jgi:hypothetical protein